MAVSVALLLSWVICLVSGLSGQTISISSSNSVVSHGNSLNISLDSYDVGQGNTFLGINGGYVLPSISDVIPLVFWNDSVKSLQLFDGIAAESPNYADRVSIPSPRVMRISNMSFPDQKNVFRFVLSYFDVTARTKSSSAITVSITAPPVAFTPLLSKTFTIREGGTVFLSCAFQGFPQVTLQWTDKSSRGIIATPINSTHLSNGFIVSRGNLTISNVKPSDAGNYECRAFNEAGITIQSTTIKVNYAPAINLQVVQPVLRACVGERISMTCEADGVPIPNVSLLDGSIVLSSSTQGTTTYNLTVTDAMFKPFLCHASNLISSIGRIITLSRRQTSSTPLSITVAPVDGNSLKVSWQPPVCIPGSGVTTYIIYARHSTTGDEKNFTATCDTGPCQHVISGLDADVSYSVSLVAVDGSGQFGDRSPTYKIGPIIGGKSSDDSNDAIFIVLAVVAGISVLLLAVFLIWYFHLRRRSQDKETTATDSAASPAKETETSPPNQPIQPPNNNRNSMEMKERNENVLDGTNVLLKFENKTVEVPARTPNEANLYDTVHDYENHAVGSQQNSGYEYADALKRTSILSHPDSEYVPMNKEEDPRYNHLIR